MGSDSEPENWQSGEILSSSLISRLSRRLSRNRVSIIQNDWAIEILRRSGDVAQFRRFQDGSAAILLGLHPTRYQLVHELKHYEHWLSDPAAYASASRLTKEEFVDSALRNCSHWKQFSIAERRHAREYIEYMRALFGK